MSITDIPSQADIDGWKALLAEKMAARWDLNEEIKSLRFLIFGAETLSGLGPPDAHESATPIPAEKALTK